MKNTSLTILLSSLLLFIACSVFAGISHAAKESPCITDDINFGSDVEIRLLRLPEECPNTGTEGKYCGRGKHDSGLYAPSPACTTPTMIVMHTTHGVLGAIDTFNFFDTGGGGNGTGTHFAIGPDGKIIQMVEMGRSQVEYAQTVGPIDDHISIEMGAIGNYGSKNDSPTSQYTYALKLVRTLMNTYNIPLSRVVSHGSLGGPAGDPGEGWINDFKRDLSSTTTSLPVTYADNTTTSGNSSENSDTSGTSDTGDTITFRSKCIVTIIGNPSVSPVLPPECQLASSNNSTNGTDGVTPGGGGQPGKPLPSQNTEEIKRVLCSQYKVCPTETDAWKSSNGWTLMQLTALWNVVQKIYESPTYRNFAIGNNVLELTRAGHYGGPSWVWGFHANGTYPDYHEIPGSRLIIITDTTNEAGSQKTLEWFFAHEIAHSASHGSKSGGWPNALGANNPAYQGSLGCKEIVSSYGWNDGNPMWDENYADTVSYYMTTGEDVTSYWGTANGGKGAGNLKIDHPCSYNVLKANYFDGKEF